MKRANDDKLLKEFASIFGQERAIAVDPGSMQEEIEPVIELPQRRMSLEEMVRSMFPEIQKYDEPSSKEEGPIVNDDVNLTLQEKKESPIEEPIVEDVVIKPPVDNVKESFLKDLSILLKESKQKKLKEDHLLDKLDSLFSQPKEEESPHPTSEQEEIIEENVSTEEIQIEEEEVKEEIKHDIPLPYEKQLNERALQILSKGQKKVNEMFSQPNPPEVSRDLKEVTQKIKYLEAWISRIASTGPGGGEVRLEFLDDVYRRTAAVDGKYLMYDASIKKWIGADGGSGGGASVSTGTEPPSTPTLGDMWWASDEGQLYIYYDDQWIQAAESVLAQENIPTDVSDLTDTTNLLFSGSYTDLTNKPSIPSALTDLGISDGANSQVLTTDGAGNFSFANSTGGISDIVNDTSPQLGGNLDAQNYSISNVSTITANTINSQLVQPDSGALLLASKIGGGTGAYISLSSSENGVSVFAANGTGPIAVSADLTQIGKAGDATLTTNAGDLILNTRSGTNSGVIRIYDQADGNILLDPNGTGIVDVQGDLTATGDVTGYAFNGRIGSVTGTSVDASFYPMFVSSIAPNQYLEGHSGLTYNPNSGILTATRFNGGFAGTLAADLNAQSFAKLINLPTPTNDGDAASKGYVDGKTEDLADNRLVYIRSGDTNVATSTDTVLDWNSELVASTIPDFTHSSGVFTNTSTRTRRFLFQMHVAIRAQSTAFTEADIWFSFNGTYNSTNRRGQTNFTGSTSAVMLTTSWTFTLAQNETVRGYFWCNQASVYGNNQSPPGSSFGNQYSSLIEVQELN